MTRFCYFTTNTPLPADRGGRVRTHHLWRALCAKGEVRMFVLGDKPSRQDRELLFAGGARLLPRRLMKTARFGRAGEFLEGIDPPGLWESAHMLQAWGGSDRFWHGLTRPDAFHRHHLNERRIARIVDEVRRFGADAAVIDDTGLSPLVPALKALGIPVIVSTHNLDSQLWLDIAANASDPHFGRWAGLVARGFEFMERTYLPLADQVWACSGIDAERFRRAFTLRDVRVVPNAIDVLPPPPPSGTRDLVYVAQMGYRPNEDAALRLIDLSRRFDARRVTHTLHLVGRPTEAIKRAAEGLPNVRVHGVVPSTAPFLAMAAVVPVTLRVGGGTRIKIVEAMAAARPVVSTAIGIEGIEARSGEDCLIVDDDAALESAVERLLDDPQEAQRIGLNGHALAQARYSHVAVTRQVAEHLSALGLALEAGDARRPPPQASAVAQGGRFDPTTRMLQWRVQVRAAHPLEDAEVELATGEDRALYNSSVSVGWCNGPGRPLQFVDIVAVLPSSVAIEDLVIRAFAYGEQVLEVRGDGRSVTEATTGLLAADWQDDGRLAGLVWTRADRAPEIVFERQAQAAVGVARPLPARPGVAVAPFVLDAADRGDPKVRRLDVRSAGAAPETGQTFWLIDAFKGRHETTSARLAALRGAHAGQTAWIIGNGPSVRTEDLDRLQGRLCFAFNRFYLAHDQTRLRPTYTVSGDRQMIEDFGQEIADRSGGTVFLADDRCPAVVGDYVWLRQLALWPPLFSMRPDRWVSPGGSSLYIALQLAWFMGIRRFYVYGADFKFVYRRERHADPFRVASGDGNHFIKNYRNNQPWCPPSFINICPAFHTARTMVESEGGWIRNVTRGGLLEMFERGDFEQALADG
ncbi:glycosyltransferase [Rubrivivax benzoatilyticus]|uniref:Glycosyltransferase n=2 Tax=Rubrivivax benzoatilyticus TaxID=316997 RepID=A0ABX0HX60_9BURK|nr:glycosyltransferase family 4 protein [Rubrivivax benzoatilyticus]NHK97935.1 glycosyltransferase [Rubrivivax benzoatilyticus]NHL23437.1 glycosyltransferase [Rubrivivax benzoatilyticus]